MGKLQHYDRLKTISLEDGFALINSGLPKTKIDGMWVKHLSLRVLSFARNGTKCAAPNCTNEGTYFAIERVPGHRTYHLNLWGTTAKGEPVLMTCDHIVARSLGGVHSLENTQTMCCWHNWDKGVKEQSQANKALESMQIPFQFRYVDQKKTSQHVRTASIVKRTFNFFLNDPLTWDTEKFVNIIWKHAGFRCVEVRLTDSTYVHPVSGKLAHRYDLFFVTGHGLLEANQVNKLMQAIEVDLREHFDIQNV